MSTHPVAPRHVRWSTRGWLAAVAAGVLETLVHVVSGHDDDIAVQVAVRAVVYTLVVLLILRLPEGRRWARIALTVLLGGLGLLSLLVEPVTWLAAGGDPAAYLMAADGPTLVVVALRAAHVLAVLAALALMYTPESNGFFRRTGSAGSAGGDGPQKTSWENV